MIRHRYRTVVAASVAVVLSGACAQAPDRTTLGARRVSLGLAYSDDALKPDVPPAVIVQHLPADPAAIGLPTAATFPPAHRVNPLACPTAPAGAVPDVPATVAFATPPPAGSYVVHNKGKLTIHTAVPLELPYPEFTTLVIRNVETKEVLDGNGKRQKLTSYVTEDQIGAYKITSSYQYDAKVLNLVSREIHAGGGTTTFTPTPAIEVFAFTGPGGSWSAAGIDTATYDSAVVSGSIAATEAIDVCGLLVDTQKASTTESQVNLRTGTQSGSRANQPTVINYATQFGGLPVRREMHTSQVVPTSQGPVRVDTDVVSTFMSIKPVRR